MGHQTPGILLHKNVCREQFAFGFQTEKCCPCFYHEDIAVVMKAILKWYELPNKEKLRLRASSESSTSKENQDENSCSPKEKRKRSTDDDQKEVASKRRPSQKPQETEPASKCIYCKHKIPRSEREFSEPHLFD